MQNRECPLSSRVKRRKVFKRTGIEGNFIKVSGSPYKLFEIAEIAAQSSKIIILTDFDKKAMNLPKNFQKIYKDLVLIQTFKSEEELWESPADISKI